jgi:hypothetical protein
MLSKNTLQINVHNHTEVLPVNVCSLPECGLSVIMKMRGKLCLDFQQRFDCHGSITVLSVMEEA